MAVDAGTTAVTSLAAACDDVREATDADAVDAVQPGFVVRPGSTEETTGVLRVAAERGLAVVARGAGTKLTWGTPPERVGLMLDLTRMAAVLDHAAGDLVAVAQAGCPIAHLQRTLAASGQRLAIDETLPGSTLGGGIATNSSGPRRMLNGTFRDLMIGTTVVRADGVIAKSGGRVVKNVAGYDLGKLMTGSFGTLGVVTDAVFRLHPLPAASGVLSADIRDSGILAAMVRAIVHSDVVPTAVEVDWSAAGGRIAVLLEGTEAGVAGRTAAARELLARAGPAEVDVDVLEQLPRWWGRYPDGVLLKLSCALSGVERVLREAAALGVAVRGSAGVGVLYGGIPVDADVTGAVTALRATCTASGGSLVVLDAPAAVKSTVDVWGPVSALELMRAVKRQFDPHRLLAPGRFVGGI
ncbi:MAG: FAD-binding oxidoreductase [Geodermatophilaceae bacterium]|nr:FAD-binding oxidoreductase [Geodermatophilaceae bacterium]